MYFEPEEVYEKIIKCWGCGSEMYPERDEVINYIEFHPFCPKCTDYIESNSTHCLNCE